MKCVSQALMEQAVKKSVAVLMGRHVTILEEGARVTKAGRGSIVTSPAPRDFLAWTVGGSVTVATMAQSVTM